MDDEEIREKLEYLHNRAKFKEVTTIADILEEVLLRQQRIMKILQVHVTPQVMELILNAN